MAEGPLRKLFKQSNISPDKVAIGLDSYGREFNYIQNVKGHVREKNWGKAKEAWNQYKRAPKETNPPNEYKLDNISGAIEMKNKDVALDELKDLLTARNATYTKHILRESR